MASAILTVKFAINKISSTVNVVAATGENSTGQLRKSTDGGATWPTTITSLGAPGSGFCGGQCFYDIAVAMDPGNANIIYLGGSGNGTNGSVLGVVPKYIVTCPPSRSVTAAPPPLYGICTISICAIVLNNSPDR